MKTRLIGTIFLTILSWAVSTAQSSSQEYIVVLRPGRSIAALNKTLQVEAVRNIPNTPVYLVLVDGASSEVLKTLRADTANVSVAEKNCRVRFPWGDEAPLDPSVVQQTASSLDGQTLTTFYGTTVLKAYIEQPAVYITRLNEVRSVSSGAATQVAYIDTGVDYSHPALQPWLAPGVDLLSNQTASETEGVEPSLLTQQMASLLDNRFSFVLNQAMASLLDSGSGSSTFPNSLGHGTLVAGIIHLFAPESRIVPIKAFDIYGNTSLFTIVEAIYRARDLKVDVLNMSFSIDDDSEVLRTAISEVQASGVAVVASVGNDASDTKRIYPAAFPQVIGVTATDLVDRLASFSNYGKAVTVAAPGAYVVSTVPGGRYAAAWGTSFSAPIVSGTIALIASGLGHGQAAAQLAVTSADNIDNLNAGFERQIGYGRINVQRTLKGK